MSAFDDLDRVVHESDEALDAFVKGDSEPLKALYSHEADVSIANPFGPPARGWQQTADTMDRAATYYRDGRATGFERMAEYATTGLAYIVEMEHFEARMGRRQSHHPRDAASDNRPSARGRDVEDRPPPCGHDRDNEAGRIGHPTVGDLMTAARDVR
jgi:hypothetical protein